MPPPETQKNPRIELDLENQKSALEPSPGHNKLILQGPLSLQPKIEPTLGETDVGSDEAERIVGIFFMISAIPGVISLFSGHGVVGGLLGIAIPIFFGLGLLHGNDFVKQWVFAACVVQLIIGPISALISPNSILIVLGGLAQSVALLILVSGKALSKQMYRCCIAAIVIGTIIETAGTLPH